MSTHPFCRLNPAHMRYVEKQVKIEKIPEECHHNHLFSLQFESNHHLTPSS